MGFNQPPLPSAECPRPDFKGFRVEITANVSRTCHFIRMVQIMDRWDVVFRMDDYLTLTTCVFTYPLFIKDSNDKSTIWDVFFSRYFPIKTYMYSFCFQCLRFFCFPFVWHLQRSARLRSISELPRNLDHPNVTKLLHVQLAETSGVGKEGLELWRAET